MTEVTILSKKFPSHALRRRRQTFGTRCHRSQLPALRSEPYHEECSLRGATNSQELGANRGGYDAARSASARPFSFGALFRRTGKLSRMVKRRQEERPPLELPPAKLFLDDLEELVRLFTEAAKREGILSEDNPPKVTYQVGIWECDTPDDLKDLGKAKDQFHLQVENTQQTFGVGIYISFDRFAWTGGFNFTPAGEWALYGQLRALFEKRKRPWYPRRRSVVIFENSFEHKGLVSSIKRHGTTILVGIASAGGALLVREVGVTIWHYFHHSKAP